MVLRGSKGARVHSQSTQHYLQTIRAMSQMTVLPNTAGHTLCEGRVASWEEYRLQQTSLNA